MKILSLILVPLLLLSACWLSSNVDSNKEACHEPENPYSAWGHYEGFEWSKSHWWVSCNGRSNSFNEWCEEFVYQLSAYNVCKK